jgi:hypothetical protein
MSEFLTSGDLAWMAALVVVAILVVGWMMFG